MAFVDMYSEIRGSVPKLSILLAKKLANRAWKEVRDKNLWSFLLGEASWLSPAQVSTGTVSVTRGSTSITFSAAAIVAILASNAGWSLITQRQFRIASGQIYNVIALDPQFAANGIATLDRIYSEQTQSGSQYLIFQNYYSAPVKDFKRFLSVSDFNNFRSLYTDRYNREQLNRIDPQRTSYGVSSDVVPYLTDSRAGSATLNYPLFELWPVPNFINNWYLAYHRKGVDMVANSEVLPEVIQEQTVIERGKYYAYQWAEANKGQFPEMQKTDWRFLMGASEKRFIDLWREDRRSDRENCDNWFFIRKGRMDSKSWPSYDSLSSSAFPGA